MNTNQSADEFGEALPLMRISTNLFDKLDNISNDLLDDLKSDNSDDNMLNSHKDDEKDLPVLNKEEYSKCSKEGGSYM